MFSKTVDTATSKCTSYEGHEAPILGVALDPEFLGMIHVIMRVLHLITFSVMILILRAKD